jgi:hypothetical protein
MSTIVSVSQRKKYETSFAGFSVTEDDCQEGRLGSIEIGKFRREHLSPEAHHELFTAMTPAIPHAPQ